MSSATPEILWKPGDLRVYKWIDALATYDVDSPWFSLGRFGDGTWKTLYLAESPEGAMAEYFRRHPEFLAFQDDLVITLHELDMTVVGDCVDVRSDAGQAAAGIGYDRLVSSEDDEDSRYEECRQLARRALSAGRVGIGYPSAAAAWACWNLVLFGDPAAGAWVCASHRPVPMPRLDGADVRVLV